MRPRLLILPAALPFAVAAIWNAASPAEPLPAPVRPAHFELQGAGSCSAAACHNADAATHHRREYAIALERGPEGVKDKHARAYDVLLERRSKLIIKNLRDLKMEAEARPHTEALCLRCHVHPAYDGPPKLVEGVRQFRREEGVSCEACHGPAERWLAAHFRGQPTPGMNDTRSLPGRVRTCVDCHVGGPGEMDVNHDLIAAGHPRLHFEFGGFHTLYHKHWDAAKDIDPQVDPRGRPDFEARAWAVGQVVSAQAALRLLAERANEKARPWPELAEYDCFACHHDLKAKTPRQDRARLQGKAGRLPWSSWYTALLPVAIQMQGGNQAPINDSLAALRKEMQLPQPDRARVAEQARRLADLLEPWAREPAGPISLATLEKLDDTKGRTWDDSAQRYLALSALQRTRRDLGLPAGASLRPMREALEMLKR